MGGEGVQARRLLHQHLDGRAAGDAMGPGVELHAHLPAVSGQMLGRSGGRLRGVFVAASGELRVRGENLMAADRPTSLRAMVGMPPLA